MPGTWPASRTHPHDPHRGPVRAAAAARDRRFFRNNVQRWAAQVLADAAATVPDNVLLRTVQRSTSPRSEVVHGAARRLAAATSSCWGRVAAAGPARGCWAAQRLRPYSSCRLSVQDARRGRRAPRACGDQKIYAVPPPPERVPEGVSRWMGGQRSDKVNGGRTPRQARIRIIRRDLRVSTRLRTPGAGHRDDFAAAEGETLRQIEVVDLRAL